MTTQQIKDNAPDGATHYDEFGNYFKLDSGQMWFRLLIVRKKVFWTAQIFKPSMNLKPL